MKVTIMNPGEVKTFLDNLKKAVQENNKTALNQAAIFVQGEVKASIAGQRDLPTTVDTGRFLNSVDIETPGDNQAIIFSEVDYAKFLEYGTSKMEARPHFDNSVQRVKEAVKELFNKPVE